MPSAEFSIHSPFGTIDDARLLQINQQLLSIYPDYIWQSGIPELKLQQIYIEGHLNFGDSIMDEWFLVYLLRQLTIQHIDLVVSVCDEDGEILLIEAASDLDSQFSPENCENRVYINEGSLHIIPLDIEVNSRIQAAQMVVKNGHNTRASNRIQDAAFGRLTQFENGIDHTFHIARVLIPIQLAVALYSFPRLISPIVNALYNREDLILKAYKQSKLTALELVEMNVKFTKLLYAQLQSITVPSVIDDEIPAALKLGMKLAVGCDILRQSAKSKFYSEKWNMYIKRLKGMDYFRGEIEGSTLYNLYLDSAKQSFLSTYYEYTTYYDFLAAELVNIWDKPIEIDKKELVKGTVDDDSYLETSMQDIDRILKEKQVFNDDDDFSSIDSDDEQGLAEIKELADSLTGFMGKQSDVYGARFPGELHSDDESEEVCEPLEFDADAFMDCLRPSMQREDALGEDDLNTLMSMMDQEINSTPIKNGDSITRDVDDVDMNLVRNLLDSFTAQQGLAGPGSNILGSLGMKFTKQ